jgi:peptide deformylase
MAVLPIIEVPDPRLKLVSEPVDGVNDEVRQLVADMFDTMYDAPGIGLAAIQVAVPKRILVIDLQEEMDADEKPVRNPHAFINPEILEVSEEKRCYQEGCLSIPEQFAEVERPDRCRARWLDLNGDTQEAWFDGLMSTCLQHEMDHLNGILFTDHLSRLKRDMVMKKLAKARKSAA